MSEPMQAGNEESERVTAICRAVWPFLHPGAKYDGWAHWPEAQRLRAGISEAMRSPELIRSASGVAPQEGTPHG